MSQIAEDWMYRAGKFICLLSAYVFVSAYGFTSFSTLILAYDDVAHNLESQTAYYPMPKRSWCGSRCEVDLARAR